MRNIPNYLIVRDGILVGYEKNIPEHIPVPSEVTEIGYDFFGYNAFRGCASLKSVVLPGSVKGISRNAFADCTSLESVTIPASVTHIGTKAFAGCTSLKEIRFGGMKAQWLNVANLGYNQNLLTVKISCSDGIVDFEHVDGLLMSGNTVYGYSDGLPSPVTIPALVTGIAAGAFAKCTSLERVTIPESVAEIGASAFQGCTSLKEIMLLCEIRKIDHRVFCGCMSLESITIPATVTEISPFAFEKCENLKEIRFGGTKEAAIKMFQLFGLEGNIVCSDGSLDARKSGGLSIIGETVCTVDGFAFFDKKRGTVLPAKMTIPSGLTNIADGAFRHWCSRHIIIADGLAEIGTEAFAHSAIKSIVIPASVKKIEADAFIGCKKLKTIRFGGTKEQWKRLVACNPELLSKKAHCADGMFYEPVAGMKITGFSAVGHTGHVPKSVMIPDGITQISGRAFSGCKSLESVTIPASMKEIGYNAFHGCSSLKSVCFGGTTEQWTEIPGIFSNCELLAANVTCADGDLHTEERNGLRILGTVVYECMDTEAQSITIPDGVKKILSHVFNGTHIENLEIPESVREIGEFGFNQHLKSVRFGGTLEQWRNIKGLSCNPDLLEATVTCTDGIQAMEMRDGVKISGGIAFGLADELTIPDGVTEIGANTFSESMHLKRISIPASVKKIEKYAFANSSNLCQIVYGGTKEEWNEIEGIDGIYLSNGTTIRGTASTITK
ncbi:MAG: leucine-rich repeat domain-containing protein [Treponemataceae bacterium]|nr:leucine-rich repeat domain-containing protein [Treponemataceae bacterium]